MSECQIPEGSSYLNGRKDAELLADRAYLNGLRQGYAMGIIGAEQAFRESENAYQTQISNHLKQPE